MSAAETLTLAPEGTMALAGRPIIENYLELAVVILLELIESAGVISLVELGERLGKKRRKVAPYSRPLPNPHPEGEGVKMHAKIKAGRNLPMPYRLLRPPSRSGQLGSITVRVSNQAGKVHVERICVCS